MSLATAGIYCMISLSGAVEDCSIVRVQQLQMLYHNKQIWQVSATGGVNHGLNQPSFCQTVANQDK